MKLSVMRKVQAVSDVLVTFLAGLRCLSHERKEKRKERKEKKEEKNEKEEERIPSSHCHYL
jgi:hypothetical protein